MSVNKERPERTPTIASQSRNPNTFRSPATMTLTDLASAQHAQDCAKTTMRPDFVVKNKYLDKTANDLEKSIVAHVNYIGGFARRVKNTGRMLDDRKQVTDVLGNTRTLGSTKYIPGTGTNGTADISAVIRGRNIEIEVKIGSDRQSEAQIKYQASIESAGGIYIIAKTFAGWIESYNELMLKFK